MITRKITSLFLLLFLVFMLTLAPLSVYASSNSIESIDVTAELQRDGSAKITQVWKTDVSDGTEFYIEQVGLGDIEIKDFTVSDAIHGQYENIGDWDIDSSFEGKAGRNGINTTADGIELCWGKTSFGEMTYTLKYTMTNFVKEYEDGAFGFYSRFINSGLSPSPNSVSVTIIQDGAKFGTDNSGIWGFGFNGEIGFTNDGTVSATSNSPFTIDSHATILMRLDQSLIGKATRSDMTFEEIQEIALEGSDYDIDEAHGNVYEGSQSYDPYEEPSSLWSTILAALLTLGPIVAIVGWFGVNQKAGDKNMAPPLDFKNLSYYRDIPYKGYLPAAFYTLSNYNKLGNQSDLISGYLLRWIKSGAVTVETRDQKTFMGLGSKQATSLVLHGAPTNAGNLEKSLYDIMVAAAGSDGILQEKELQNWSSANYSTLSAWFDSAKRSGKNYYEQKQLLTTEQQPYAFKMLKRTVTTVNAAGLQENQNLFGFKKYLQDYTLIKDRAPNEVQLWDEYLVFASLFGIADQVVKDFKQINPKFFEAPEYQQGGGNYDFFTTYLFLNALSRSSYSGMQAGRYASSGTRSGGGGGFSSFGGGGGGFSGGGFGGGSR